MSHIFISLGSACDVAINLQSMGLRSYSLPFDWLWNQDYGLDFVRMEMECDWKNVTSATSYELMKHIRFDNPVVVYKEYPNLIHLHSNPLNNQKDHEQLVRRWNRFQSCLVDNDQKYFIYYRNAVEDQLLGKSKSIEDSFEILKAEVNSLLQLMERKYPSVLSRSSWLFVLQVNEDDYRNTRFFDKEWDQWIKNQHPSVDIQFSRAIHRDDSNKRKIRLWKSQWRHLIRYRTKSPLNIRIYTYIYPFWWMLKKRLFQHKAV